MNKRRCHLTVGAIVAVTAVMVTAVMVTAGMFAVARRAAQSPQTAKSTIHAPSSSYLQAAFTGSLVLAWGYGQPGAFDPTADRWVPVPALPRPLDQPTLLWEGAWTGGALVLVTNLSAKAQSSIEAIAWTPGHARWTRLPQLPFVQFDSIVAGGGRAFVEGDTGRVVELEPGHGAWRTPTWALPDGYNLVVADGGMLLAAMARNPYLPIMSIDVRTGGVHFNPLAPEPVALSAVGGERIFAWTAWTGTWTAWTGDPDLPAPAHIRLNVLDLARGTWTQAPPSPLQARSGRQAVWTGRGLLALAQPLQETPGIDTAALWAPSNNAWYTLPDPPASGGCGKAFYLLAATLGATLPACTAAFTTSTGAAYVPPSGTFPACKTAQLTADAYPAGSVPAIGGAIQQFIGVSNTGRTACTISTIPAITLLAGTGQHVPVRVVVDPAVEFDAGGTPFAGPQGSVVVQPGIADAAFLESGFSNVAVHDVCKRSLTAPAAVLAFPDGDLAAVPEPRGEPPTQATLLDCDGTLTVSPWRPTYSTD